MGTTASTAAISTTTPFAISDKTNTDLNRLSFIATRLLSSSDLYDLENLAKPGTCGNYSVFLQKGIENTLLPFVVDIDNGQLAEVFYQDPRKAFNDLEKRKRVCKDLTVTMLRAIATVTASLASIQVVKSRSRDAIVMAAEKQKGGDIQAVGRWLLDANFINSYQTAGKPMDFATPGGMHTTPRVKFTLTLVSSSGELSKGWFNAIDKSGRGEYPNGGLQVFFLYQMMLPGTQTTVMPIRVEDMAGKTLLAGILVDGRFKSFVDTTPHEYITAVLDRIFLMAGGAGVVGIQESRSQLAQAYDIFDKLYRARSPIPMLQALNRYFSELGIGYQPVAQSGYIPQPIAYGAQPYGAQPIAYGAQPYGAQPYGAYYNQPGYLQPQQRYPVAPGAIALRAQAAIEGQTELPINAVRYILDRLKVFQKAIAIQSCPAEERAAALIGAGYDENQNIRTGICNDPYWKKANLNDVHPWATFQFLATEEWENAGDRSKPLHPEWARFLDGLIGIYGNNFSKQQGSFLDQARFTGLDKLPICTSGSSANKQKIFAGINELQYIYQGHVTKIWNIINSLIVVIQHPESKKDVIRFHPTVLRSGKSSRNYVKGVAESAMGALREHYLAIETAYFRVAKDDNLQKR